MDFIERIGSGVLKLILMQKKKRKREGDKDLTFGVQRNLWRKFEAIQDMVGARQNPGGHRLGRGGITHMEVQWCTSTQKPPEDSRRCDCQGKMENSVESIVLYQNGIGWSGMQHI